MRHVGLPFRLPGGAVDRYVGRPSCIDLTTRWRMTLTPGSRRLTLSESDTTLPCLQRDALVDTHITLYSDVCIRRSSWAPDIVLRLGTLSSRSKQKPLFHDFHRMVRLCAFRYFANASWKWRWSVT